MSLRPEILTSLCVVLFSAVWLSWLAADTPLNTKLITVHASPAQSEVSPNSSSGSHSVDACALLTSTEIAAVLGEPLRELKPSTQATGNMNMSHCLFITRDFTKSASLAVATPRADDSGARRLRAFWHNQFHSPRPHEEEKRPASVKTPSKSAFTSWQSEDEAEEDSNRPRLIPALGEEAYWVGSPLSGALYVLQGELFLRISVGGVPKESTRIAKSKSLASAILSRLHHR